MLHATDVGVIVLIAIAGGTTCYLFVIRKMRQIVAERELRIADQLGALDLAIQAIETRLAEYRTIGTARESELTVSASEQEDLQQAGESIAGEIKAVIAVAATAAFDKKVSVKSIRSVPTPWSQQGRVMVQGSHNLRVRQ
jgi:N-acetylglucosamine kinase-like BadF-type ATPase